MNQIEIRPSIGCAYGAGEEIKANAALMAAAPDLLEACQEYDAWADKVVCKDADLRVIREKIRAAIAKALGEQP